MLIHYSLDMKYKLMNCVLIETISHFHVKQIEYTVILGVLVVVSLRSMFSMRKSWARWYQRHDIFLKLSFLNVTS